MLIFIFENEKVYFNGLYFTFVRNGTKGTVSQFAGYRCPQ